MRLLILGDADNAHIFKWANGLAEAGIEILIFSLFPRVKGQLHDNIKVIEWQVSPKLKLTDDGNWAKLYYLGSFPKLKKIIKEFKPDILHAHYATSYGLLGNLTRFHPFILSVWGADVFTFPGKSPLHKKLLEYNLNNADRILSTSHMMAREIEKFTDKEVEVTPFGIDVNRFKPGEKSSLSFENKDLVIGTIKTLELKYGIEYLIEAFCLVKNKLKDKNIKLLIVGGGTREQKVRDFVSEKGVANDVIITGRVHYSEIHKFHNNLDIYIALSVDNDESFGVAILEASATEKPVVVSNVGGLPEVVVDGETGFVVPPRDPQSTADKIIELILNPALMEKMGKAGRQRVLTHYVFENNLQQMIEIYKSVLIQKVMR